MTSDHGDLAALALEGSSRSTTAQAGAASQSRFGRDGVSEPKAITRLRFMAPRFLVSRLAEVLALPVARRSFRTISKECPSDSASHGRAGPTRSRMIGRSEMTRSLLSQQRNAEKFAYRTDGYL